MKRKAKVPQTSDELLHAEMATLQLRVDAAAGSAHALASLILIHKPELTSGGTILHETAILLQHSAQNFGRFLKVARDGQSAGR